MDRIKTDFAKILTELRDIGFNDYRMAELTNINRSMLSKLRVGKRKQPNYDDGAEIIKVYSNNTVEGRFIQIFESHGIHRNQIPRFFDQGLTLKDVSTNKNLLPKLNHNILKAACELFSVHLEWLEGADNTIYKTHNFYKHPEKYANFLKKLKKETQQNGNTLIPRLIITTDTSEDYDALIVIEEHLNSINESVVRYHLCNGWVHRSWKARADLTACIAMTMKQVGFMKGMRTNVPLEGFCEAERLMVDLDDLPLASDRHWRGKNKHWKPEQWVFDADLFVDKLEEGNFGKANALARLLSYYEDGYMETGYLGENPEPEFKILLEAYKK